MAQHVYFIEKGHFVNTERLLYLACSQKIKHAILYISSLLRSQLDQLLAMIPQAIFQLISAVVYATISVLFALLPGP